jgi:hypothetical protein
MLLTLFSDSSHSAGAPIESSTVSLDPSDTSLTMITVDSVTNALLPAGDQYWISVVLTDPIRHRPRMGTEQPPAFRYPSPKPIQASIADGAFPAEPGE